jgi:hypothetical protein
MELSAAQGKDTCGFLPLHPFLPFIGPACWKTGSACVHEMEGVKSPP